jgi:hypothetical protein
MAAPMSAQLAQDLPATGDRDDMAAPYKFALVVVVNYSMRYRLHRSISRLMLLCSTRSFFALYSLRGLGALELSTSPPLISKWMVLRALCVIKCVC